MMSVANSSEYVFVVSLSPPVLFCNEASISSTASSSVTSLNTIGELSLEQDVK